MKAMKFKRTGIRVRCPPDTIRSVSNKTMERRHLTFIADKEQNRVIRDTFLLHCGHDSGDRAVHRAPQNAVAGLQIDQLPATGTAA